MAHTLVRMNNRRILLIVLWHYLHRGYTAWVQEIVDAADRKPTLNIILAAKAGC
jgi:hypothetical protein